MGLGELFSEYLAASVDAASAGFRLCERVFHGEKSLLVDERAD